MPPDEVEGCGRLESRLADEPARDERHREQRAHAHGVIERHHAEGAFAVAVAVLRDVGDGGGALGGMGSRDSLGASGGAGGVEHDRDVVRTRARGCGGGRAAGELVEPDGAATGLVYRNSGDVTGVRGVRDRVGRHRLEAHCPGAGIVEHVVELIGLRAPVHRCDHHARELAGPVQGRGFETVLEDRDEMVAAAEPDRVESGHGLQRTFQPFAVGECRFPVDNRGGGGLAFDDVEEGAAEVEHRRVSNGTWGGGVTYRVGAGGGRSAPVGTRENSYEVNHRGRLGLLVVGWNAAPRRAPHRRWGYSRCTGTGDLRVPRERESRPVPARVRADR